MRALLAYNLGSGKKRIKDKLDYISNYLNKIYEVLDKFELKLGNDIVEYLIINGSLYDVVIVAGGDGSVHSVVNGIIKSKVNIALAVIPFGTCNDVAKTLGFSSNINKSLAIIKENKRVSMDAFSINKQYFIYGLAAGSLTEISYSASSKAKRLFGKLAYYLYVLKVFNKNNSVDVKVITDDLELEDSYSVIVAINSRYLAGFKVKNRNVCLNDGKLLVVLIKNKNKFLNVFSVGRLLAFGVLKSKNIKYIDTEKLVIKSNDSVAYNTDGEFFSNENSIEVSVENNAITVIAAEKVINKYFKV